MSRIVLTVDNRTVYDSNNINTDSATVSQTVSQTDSDIVRIDNIADFLQTHEKVKHPIVGNEYFYLVYGNSEATRDRIIIGYTKSQFVNEETKYYGSNVSYVFYKMENGETPDEIFKKKQGGGNKNPENRNAASKNRAEIADVKSIIRKTI